MHQLVQVQEPRLEHLPTTEREQLVGELRRARGRLPNLVDVIARGAIEGGILQQDLRRAQDGGEQIVEVVRDAPGELNHRLDALGTADLGLPGPLGASPDGVGGQDA